MAVADMARGVLRVALRMSTTSTASSSRAGRRRRARTGLAPLAAFLCVCCFMPSRSDAKACMRCLEDDANAREASAALKLLSALISRCVG
eukprot:3106836-Rhodomonas_salina.2